MHALGPILSIARDLTANLANQDRFERLLRTARTIIPFDAACLLQLIDGETLLPLAGIGLAPEALRRRYLRSEHPRLDRILSRRQPIQFEAESDLPDPFDGALADDRHDVHGIHSCMGCALYDGDELVGAFTADAMDRSAFDAIDDQLVATLGALAGAALRTSLLIDALEHRAKHQRQVARDMMRLHHANMGTFIGSSAPVRCCLQQVDAVAATMAPVLITGETGTGKELIAHLVHQRSLRHQEVMIEVNCAALPEGLAESELFGHAAGAFTGAQVDRRGKFALADQGTLFLDETDERPLAQQGALLRVLQAGQIQRPGADEPVRCDVRIVAATNRDLRREIERGRFREDLFHRLSVFPIHLPPLRERVDDIPLLVAHFGEQARVQFGLERVQFSHETIDRLCGLTWTGNVRELANVIERSILLARSPGHDHVVVDSRHIPSTSMQREAADGPTTTSPSPVSAPAAGLPLKQRVEQFKRQAIAAEVEAAGGNWSAAARELGLHRANLHQMAKRLGLRL